MQRASRVLGIGLACALFGAQREAHADEEISAEQVQLEAKAPKVPEEAPLEAPPPPPHKKGFVLDGAIGMLGFAGQFRKAAPPAPWLHIDFGYEPFKWFLVFVEGELAFTDTSNLPDVTRQRAFPIFGFGAGGRFQLHVSTRVSLFAQGQLGFMKADIANNALAIVGFKGAESLGAYFGGRVGVEWAQIDRHLALALHAGLRDATGFAKDGPVKDTPLMWDGALALRYTF